MAETVSTINMMLDVAIIDRIGFGIYKFYQSSLWFSEGYN